MMNADATRPLLSGFHSALFAFFIAAATALSAASAAANEIALQLSAIPRGMVVVYERGDGTTFSQHYVGISTDGYRIDHYVGDMATGPTRTSVVDAEGNTLSYTQPDGRSRTYSPHACNRAPGTCRVDIVDQKGK